MIAPLGNDKWEYHMLSSGDAPDGETFFAECNRLGSEGWEAFAVQFVMSAGMIWYFKRKKSAIMAAGGRAQ